MERRRKVIRADVLGYCMGVRRAVEAVLRELEESPLRPVYTYGPLIHNAAALERLKSLGAVILMPLSKGQGEGAQAAALAPLPEDFGGRAVVIRAHGIPPLELAELKRRGARIVDATCPRVLSSQRLAQKFHAEGVPVILAGDKSHAEIKGIAGFAPGCVVLESACEAEAFARSGCAPARAALIGQTTIRQAEYDAIARALSVRVASLAMCPTICPATEERQAALVRLASVAEGIVVVGGRNSANTKRLFAAAQALSSRAWLIESADEISAQVYSINCVGLAAGASTPDEVIDAVEKKLLEPLAFNPI